MFGNPCLKNILCLCDLIIQLLTLKLQRSLYKCIHFTAGKGLDVLEKCFDKAGLQIYFSSNIKNTHQGNPFV